MFQTQQLFKRRRWSFWASITGWQTVLWSGIPHGSQCCTGITWGLLCLLWDSTQQQSHVMSTVLRSALIESSYWVGVCQLRWTWCTRVQHTVLLCSVFWLLCRSSPPPTGSAPAMWTDAEGNNQDHQEQKPCNAAAYNDLLSLLF